MDTFAKNKPKTESPAAHEKPAEELQPVGQLQDDALIILPVRRMVLFPGATVPIAIGRPKSIAAVKLAIQASRPVGVVMQREAEIADPQPEDLFEVGTLAKIIRHMPTGNGAHHLICEGLQRIRLKEFRPDFPFLVASYTEIKTSDERSAEIDARFLQLKERALEALGLLEGIPQDFINTIAAIDQPSALADLVAQHMDLESQEKQEILETADLKTRLDRMIDILGYRIEVLKLSQDIGRQTQEKLSAQQRGTR